MYIVINIVYSTISMIDFSNIYFVYFLGLLWADGHVPPKHNDDVLVYASGDDSANLKNLQLNMPQYKPKLYHNQHKFNGIDFGQLGYTLYLSDCNLKTLLKECDYMSKSVSPPEKILNKIHPSLRYLFWRGIFDGDGCFYSNLKSKTITSIWSTIDQDWKSLFELFSNLKISQCRYIKYSRKAGRHRSSVIELSKADNISKFITYIYQGHLEVGLIRKRDKCLAWNSKKIQAPPNCKGVYYEPSTGKWSVHYTGKTPYKYVGRFATEESAIVGLRNFELQNNLPATKLKDDSLVIVERFYSSQN